MGVVVKTELDSAFKLSLGQRFERAQPQAVFESSPKSFDDRDGAVFTDGAESLLSAEPLQLLLKPVGRELSSLVGDEMPRRAEVGCSP